MAGRIRAAPNPAVSKPIPLGALALLSQMSDFLKRPLIALGFSAICVALLFVASKEVKLFLYLLEYYGIADRPREGALYGIMTGSLVIFMWLDILVVAYAKDGVFNLLCKIRGKLKFN